MKGGLFNASTICLISPVSIKKYKMKMKYYLLRLGAFEKTFYYCWLLPNKF